MTIKDKSLEQIFEGREEDVKCIIKSFLDLRDIRYTYNVHYSLEEVLFLVLCSQISGFDSFREYEMYGKSKINFLKSYLPYKHGIPSHTTIGRVLSILEPNQLEKIFIESMQSIISEKKTENDDHDNDKNQNTNEQDVIPIDGKRHRGFRKKHNDNNTLHIVSAYSTNNGLTLGQVKVPDKTNEIKAIPNLLNMLHISGQIITIDAAGCQIEIVKKIRSKNADYIISLKGNQGTLHESVREFFDDQENIKNCSFYEAKNKGHGRIEHRKCYVATIQVPDEFKKWKDIKTVIMLESSRIIKGVEQKEIRYFISSLEADAQKILSAIRIHWNIENNSHWVLDVVFREDDRIIWNLNIAYNESIIRRLSLNLLKEYQKVALPLVRSDKIPIKSLRKLIAADDLRMSELLGCF